MRTGYVRITLPDGRRVAEHRHVWEQAHGRIPAGGMIHHKNGDKTDNRIANLELVMSQREHSESHGGGLRTNYRQRPVTCGHDDRRHYAHGLCHPCYMKQWHARRRPRITS